MRRLETDPVVNISTAFSAEIDYNLTNITAGIMTYNMGDRPVCSVFVKVFVGEDVPLATIVIDNPHHYEYESWRDSMENGGCIEFLHGRIETNNNLTTLIGRMFTGRLSITVRRVDLQPTLVPVLAELRNRGAWDKYRFSGGDLDGIYAYGIAEHQVYRKVRSLVSSYSAHQSGKHSINIKFSGDGFVMECLFWRVDEISYEIWADLLLCRDDVPRCSIYVTLIGGGLFEVDAPRDDMRLVTQPLLHEMRAKNIWPAEAAAELVGSVEPPPSVELVRPAGQ